MKCKTCSHPRRQDINLALLAGNHTFETLGNIYGLSTSSLFRHKKHLEEKMRRTRQRLQDSQAQCSLLKLSAILDNVQRAVQAAEADGNVDQVLKGSHVGSRIIHQITKMAVPLDLETVYRLISSPQWVSQDSLLPTDPQVITDIHQAVVDDALFPCPELHLEPVEEEEEDDDADEVEDWDESDDEGNNQEKETSATTLLENRNSELRTQDPELLSQLQQLLARLNLTVNNDRETTPKKKREKSAKLPKNMSFRSENNKQIQLNNQYEKYLAKNPCPIPSSLFPGVSPTGNLHVQTDKNSELNIQKLELPIEPLESRNPELVTPQPPGLTPEMRAQIFTPLFPKGNGARDPEKIQQPGEKPPASQSSKKGKLSKLIRLFQRNKESSPEGNLISPHARNAGRENEVPLHLTEIYEGYQKDIQEGIIVPGAFNRLLADIHPPGPGHLESGW